MFLRLLSSLVTFRSPWPLQDNLSVATNYWRSNFIPMVILKIESIIYYKDIYI